MRRGERFTWNARPRLLRPPLPPMPPLPDLHPDDRPAAPVAPARLAEAVERLQATVAQMERELARTHHLATLGALAGMIAHEFNNILTPVLSYAQLALKHPEDAELGRTALERCALGVERASKVATAILGFAGDERHGVGAADGGPLEAEVGRVLEETLFCLARPLERDRIRLERRIEEGLRVAVAPEALQQVLMNLILNARKAMLPRGGRLVVAGRRARAEECSTWNAERAWAVVEVADSGKGIPEDLLPRIFDPFVSGGRGMAQNDGGPRVSEGGSGLGLVICRRLVEEVGGRIEVVSEVGVGTTFRVWVPEGR